MKRKEKKLKSKFGFYKYQWIECAPSLMKYDRKYVARHVGDVRHLPFSRGNYGDWSSSWFKWGMYNYIEHFLRKRVGMDVDLVFHQFSKLGWKNSHDMYDVWRRYVEPWYYCYGGLDFSVSEKGVLKANHEGDEQAAEPEENEKKWTSEKLTYRQKRHNSKVKVPMIRRCTHRLSKGVYAGQMGKFYVKYEGRVVLCHVYHIVCRDSQYWSQVHRDYLDVNIFGISRYERSFDHCLWYCGDEDLEDMRNEEGIIRWTYFHCLRPMVKLEEVRRQLRKAAP